MKKRILSLLLVLIMVLGMLPVSAMATETNDTVYISVSFDGQYVNDKNGEPMAYIPVSLSELQAIDLEEYDLTEYDYNGQLTALHLYIYTHEKMMGKDWSNVGVSGGAGSIFFENGLFGFQDCNLQYYCNGEYPEVDGWGVTADQLVLNNGDFFDIAAYTSWSFFSDSAFGFHYFLDNDEITHEYAATAGEALSVTLGRGASFMGGDGSTITKVGGYTVSYGTAFGTATGTVTTNTDGQAEITFAEAGTYYLWVDGGYGAENPLDIVSAPGCAKVTVEAPACTHETWNPATCTTPKTCAACGETEGEADPEAHSYVDGTCEHCGAAEPAATPSYTIKLSEAEELTAGLNYFISVPAEVLGKDIIFDFGSGTISGAMCQRHCSKRDIWTAGEGSTMIIAADKVAAHLCNETRRAEIADDFNLYLTEGSQMFAFYWWTSANMNGSYIYIEILPVEEECAHETWNPATCTTPKTCSVCGATEGEADPEAHNYVNGTCEHCGAAEPVATPSYTIKLSEAEELTAGLNYFISVPAEALGKDIIFDFGSGTISGMMCQRHCSQRNIHTAGEGSTLILSAETVAAHLCNETRRGEVAEDFDLYLTDGSQMFAFYWWTTANLNGSYIYIEILPAEDAGGGDEEATYTVTLPTDNVGFSVRATSSPTVTSGGEFSFNLNIYDDYKKGENFKVKANGVELTSSGDTYTITNITANQTVTVEGVVEKTLAEKNVTVNAPAGSVVSSGAFHSYFKYDFVEPLQISTLEDGRVQYIVPATSGVGGFIRVQNPNGVTYWDFGDLTIGKVFDITDEMLFIGNTEYTKDTVFANYEKNGHDTASLYLTANAQGWLDMDTGDTHSLNVFRNWIPVSNSTTNTGVSLPDVTYTVVDVNGNASDVVTVTPDANNSCYADIKAVKAGTAIILVSYDAVYNADGEGGKQFSAIWPENTGVIVVTVDAEDADIQTNITVNEEANAGGKQILDVEHDILFYVGNAGAEYRFKPENGCTVTISRSTVGNEMTFNGFTNEGVTVAADGTVTLSGLTTGAHIVKVEKDGKTAYQVIRTREVSYELTHSNGAEVTHANPAQPGESITVQFTGLIAPLGKLSGVYNANFGFYYNGEDGAAYRVASGYPYGDYYFGSNAVRQRFTATVPAEWGSATYTLTDGGIKLGGFGGSFGAHRSTTYMTGKEVNTNASGTAGVASVLPDVVIPVYQEPQCPVNITAPLGSTVSVGVLKNYYIYTFAEPVKIVENEVEGTVTYGFDVPENGNYNCSFVRVQHPEGVTYWHYVKLDDGTAVTVTEDDLFLNDANHNSDTVIRDFSEYQFDVADIYLNANSQGWLSMENGDTFEFNVFRNWHAVEGISNNKTALPDVHYQVIGIDGTESDVLTIVPDANNSSTAVMTANKAGTAIVLVTYDAMYSTLALRGGSGTAAAEPAFFSAIWPENTGVVVVTVDADGSLQTNMMLNNHVLDAEHDVLYYLGTDGASYSFAPESGSAVSVARSTVTDKMSFCGFTTEGIVVAEDGTVTVTGLTTGTHIIKVEKDGAISYQVIRAKATTVTVTDSEGEIVSTENPVEPGETVTLQFGALYNPIGKLPTIYNSGAQIIATGEDGTSAYGSAGEGAGAYYLFAWDTECHKVQITVPETWLKATFDVNGFLKGSGFGSLAGGHRSVTYKDGAVKDDNAPVVSGGFGLLPTVQLPVNVDTSVSVTSVALDKTTAAMMVGEQLTLTPLIEPADTTFVPVWISSDASVAAVENGVVTANGEGSTTITLTIGGLSASCEITVSKPSGGLEIVTGSTARVMASRLLSKIRLVGVEGSLQEGYTETEYVIKLPANTDKDKMIVVEMTAELISAAKKKAFSNKIYFWANTPNATNKSEKSVYGYSADCSAPGSLAVQPEWDGNTAIITLGLGDASSIVANSGNTKQYTLTLIIESDSEPTTHTVTLPTGTGYTVAATEGSTSPVTKGGSYSFTVAITNGYEAGEDFAVKANDTKLTAVEGVYTIENITADQTVTVEGVEVIPTYTVTLPTETTGYTVTAAEGSTSPVTKGGSYSFTVAIAEGYEAGENFAVKANDTKLTAVEGVYTIENITADQTVTVEGVVEKREEPARTWQEVMAMTQTYLTAQAENEAPIVGTNKGEWMVLGLARNGMNADNDIFKGYYDNVVRFVEEKIDTVTGRLDKNQATVNVRVILGLTSIGKDVTDVAGHNLLKGLSDTDFVKKQGINGPIWTLIALDSHDYEIPTNADSSKQVTRQWLVDYILDNQLEGGGWKISGTSPDDMTPMAVQALAPYYNSNADVKAAIDKALTIMEGMVENGSPETLAQIIVARSTMGLDSEEIVNKMLAFALEDGSFKQNPFATNANQMSTEQAFYAMVAYSRFLNNKTALYDMSDVVIEEPAEQDKPVESVTLSSSTLSMKVGETDTLVALVSPADATNRAVSWSSSNTGVATVSSNGVVTAVAEGSAIITATAGEKSASCIVTVTKESSSEPKLEFGLTEDEIVGYVTISFEDNATRKSAELSEIESEFRSPLGTIIRSTRVPFKEGDTIASVTLRLLAENEFTASYEGDEYGSFYLEAIGNFTAKGTYYRSFGEFDAGRDSGWMITWNDWFIDQGASEFEVENGDVVRWQYTCQLGADIGDVDWNDTPTGGTTTEDRAAAREIKGLIEAIGTVTKNSGAAIKAARSAYNALTDAQKDLVPNYDDLVTAEKKYAELTKDETKRVFTDVSESDYYYEAVKWAVELGITNGTSDTTFSPNASCTRAQMVTFLWRAAGEPKAKSATCVFTDVDKDAYCYEALLWAVENGITNGTSDTTFSPDADCNRGQMATFLYRSAKTPVVSGNHAFHDVKAAAYYNDAVIWAAARGITKGTSDTTFSPDADCTRGQMVTFLYRYLAK